MGVGNGGETASTFSNILFSLNMNESSLKQKILSLLVFSEVLES